MDPCLAPEFVPRAAQIQLNNAISKPLPVPTSKVVHGSATLPPPQNHPDISQLWREDVRRAARILDNELGQYKHLSLADSKQVKQPVFQQATSWPPAGHRRDNAWPWLNDTTRLSSSPLSDDSGTVMASFSARNNVTSPQSTGSINAEDGNKAWAFCPSWSLDHTPQDPRVPKDANTGSRFYASPTPDIAYESDTDSSGNSNYGGLAPMSPNPSQPESLYNILGTANAQQSSTFRNHEHNKTVPSFDMHQLSQALFASDKSINTNSTDTSSRLLVSASRESMLTSQLARTSMQTFVPIGFMLFENQIEYPHYSRDTKRLGGPVPWNRKTELYKTEMCRNWEERGVCEYGM